MSKGLFEDSIHQTELMIVKNVIPQTPWNRIPERYQDFKPLNQGQKNILGHVQGVYPISDNLFDTHTRFILESHNPAVC